ncbi:MAG: hypothetical protein CM1200mP24_09120 [Gammaproteobacteria bacterium]|nr:MAG: hypothetical protein CM1200mP24_09120 [Gammaproteobacteria bacterium]
MALRHGYLLNSHGRRLFWISFAMGKHVVWGAQVIVSLAGAIPVIGPDLMEWVRGDYLMSEITLNRFFACM